MSRQKKRNKEGIAQLIRSLNSKGQKQVEIPRHFSLSITDSQSRRRFTTIVPRKVEDYTFARELRRGSLTIINVATEKKSGRKVVMKIYDKLNIILCKNARNSFRESHIMSRLRHSSIVSFIEHMETSKGFCIVMEYIHGQNLKAFIKTKLNMTENYARRLFKPIAEAVSYMHAQQVAHRNLKLKNILVDRFQMPKIIDFGCASMPLSAKNKACHSSLKYIPPEQKHNQEACVAPADIWALGVILFFILSGSFPFNPGQETESDLSSMFELSLPEHLTFNARSLLKGMLDPCPESRYTATEVLSCLWMNSKT